MPKARRIALLGAFSTLPILMLVAGLAGRAAALSPTAGAPAISGKTLAQEACSACHQVGPGQNAPPLVANPDEGSKIKAPSFMEIAKRCESARDLRGQITNPHYPMREQAFGDIDIDALIGYIRSLAPAEACPIR